MGTQTRKLETQGEKPDLFATRTWLWKMVPQLTLIFVTKTWKPQNPRAKTNIFVTRTQPEHEKQYPNTSLPKPEEIRFERFF